MAKLLGGEARVKVMRFFLTNPYEVFAPPDIARILKIPKKKLRQELKGLLGLKFLRKGVKETEVISARTKRLKKKKEPGFALNNIFPYARELRQLVVEASSVSRELLQKRFKKLGRGLKLVILSGFFSGRTGEENLDILVVGENIRRSAVEKIIGKIEAEIGKELRYALFSTEDFKYRRSMYDKFIMEILEGGHEKLIDNLGI